jgi:hypothetical protein
MFILVAMLLYAMITTGNFDWWPEAASKPLPSDYAICFLSRKPNLDSNAFSSMIVSTFLVGFGFVSRVVRLHMFLAVDIFGRSRETLSEKTQALLSTVYGRLDVQNSPRSLMRTCCYHPLLALFLITQVVIDMFLSIFMEVGVVLQDWQ